MSTRACKNNAAGETINDVTYLQESTKQVILKAGLRDDYESVALLEKFNGWKNPFSGTVTSYNHM